MFFYKSIDQRNHIIVPGRNASVILDIFILHFTILVHNKLRSKSISIHIVIITHIVLRKYKRDLTRRKHNAASGHCSILIYNRHIVRADHYIALIIHTLYDLVKFINRCHILIISVGIRLPVKCLRRIFDQCMEKNMGDLFQRIFCTGCPDILIFRNCILHICITVVIRLALKQFYRPIVIILRCHKGSLFQRRFLLCILLSICPLFTLICILLCIFCCICILCCISIRFFIWLLLCFLRILRLCILRLRFLKRNILLKRK